MSVCEKCGIEIRGELCENCYSKEDQAIHIARQPEKLLANCIKSFIFSAVCILVVLFVRSLSGLGTEKFNTIATNIFSAMSILFGICAFIFLIELLKKKKMPNK